MYIFCGRKLIQHVHKALRIHTMHLYPVKCWNVNVHFKKYVCVQRNLHRVPLILHLFFTGMEWIKSLFLWYVALVWGCSYKKQIRQLTKASACWEQREFWILFFAFLVLIYCCLLLAIHIVHLCNSLLKKTCVVFTHFQDDAVGNLHGVQIPLQQKGWLF